jgi:phosphate transport system substrate-binding protein
MRRETRRLGIALALAGIIVISAFMAGCTQNNPDERSVSISGSTTVLPIAQAAADAWMKKHGNDEIIVSGGGSSTGVKNVAEKTSDIGMASRELKDTEKSKYPDLVQHVVAKDGIGIIVHKTNTVPKLSEAQVKGIYNGTYTNWKDVGGPDKAIVVIGRDSASGTREFFYGHVMEKEDFVSGMREMNSNGAVKSEVENTPGAIGYVGLGYIDAKVKGIPIDTGSETVNPTVANVINGKYPIARNLNMFTVGQPKGLAKDYIDFIKSADGQKIVEDEGFVPI